MKHRKSVSFLVLLCILLVACRTTPAPTPVEPSTSETPPSEVFVCMRSKLNCYAEPSFSSERVCKIPLGTRVEVSESAGDFLHCKLSDGTEVYCDSSYLVPDSEAQYVRLDGAVDLREYLPDMEYDLLFASDRNITGKPLYPGIPVLEETTAEMLAKAYEIFRFDGYTIKICDAYRPKSAQYVLFDIVKDSRFIADPYHGASWHQSGRAVDMTLVNAETGEELEMPTPMHTFADSAARYSESSWTETARANVAYMTEVMESVGFTTITTEWWHFQNSGEGGYLPHNLDFAVLERIEIPESLQS